MKKVLILAALLFSATTFADVDLSKSKLNWKGTKITGQHVGTVNFKSATVKLDKKNMITSGEFVVDMKSITVTDLEGEWKDKFLNHVATGDFFEVNKYPTAKFVVSKDTGSALEGKLTIKGKTQDAKITYTKTGKMYKGTLKFDRTKFGIVYGSKNFFKNLGDKVIHDEVTLNFDIALK